MSTPLNVCKAAFLVCTLSASMAGHAQLVAKPVTGSPGMNVAAERTAVSIGAPASSDAQEKTITAYAPYMEHRSTVRVGKTAYVMMKLNYGGKLLTDLAVAADGSVHPATSVRKAYLSQFSGFGRVHPTLHRALADPKRSHFDVAVWLDLPPPPAMNRPGHVAPGEQTAVRAKLRERWQAALKPFVGKKQQLLDELKLTPYVDEQVMRGSPFARIPEMTRDSIKRLAESPAVRMVLLYDPDGRVDLADAMAIAGAPTVHAGGTTGTGVRVAVYEGAPTDTTNLNVIDSYSASAGITPFTSDHAQHVSAIINNSNAVSGFAPDSDFYSADDYDLAALDWAIDDADVSAVNQSFHRAAEIGDGMQTDDLYKDYRALHYPWPTIVHAAGNWCPSGTSCYESGSDVTDEFVNHKGFNTISVGNHNDDATRMSASSCFVNPSSPHGDRELPELSANGTGVTADGMTKSGTSMASPAVTGSVALIQETAPTLEYWPEGVRAILLAGAATNVPEHDGQLSGGGDAADAPNTWWRDVALGNDGFDGAGALNVARSADIAEFRWDGIWRSRGWDVGYAPDSSFADGGYFHRSYRVQVPTSVWAVRPHVRVALAWASNATITSTSPETVYGSALNMDLDLRVYDSTGSQVAYSLSWDNSYEVVDFVARPGEVYEIRIKRHASAGTNSWMGIAWQTTWQPIRVNYGILRELPFTLTPALP